MGEAEGPVFTGVDDDFVTCDDGTIDGVTSS